MASPGDGGSSTVALAAYARAAALYAEALTLAHATDGQWNQIAVCLEGLAAVTCAAGHAARSVRPPPCAWQR